MLSESMLVTKIHGDNAVIAHLETLLGNININLETQILTW